MTVAGRRVPVLLKALPLLLLIPAAAGLAVGIAYLRSPPGALDLVNDFVPGDRGAARIAGGVPFGPNRLRLDVWAAPAPASVRRPVLVFFYGGAWVKGRRQDYGFVGKAYAARGFVVVVPDYRLVPKVRFPAFVADGAAAVRWAHDNIARYGGDPQRIVLAGHSAGAYIAILLALDRHYLGVAGVDPNVVRAAAGLAGPYDFYPFTSERAVDALGRWPDPRATQPIAYARADAPPLWLATGTADTEVRPRNSVALAARERALGSRTTTLRLYPGLSHDDLVMAISKPFRGKAPALAESVAFFDHALARPDSLDRWKSGT